MTREAAVAVMRGHRVHLDRIHAGVFQSDSVRTSAGVCAHKATGAAARSAVTAKTPRTGYLIPITIESGPTRASTLVEENPASFIQLAHSAPV